MSEHTAGDWTIEPCGGTTRPDLVILADGLLLARVFTHYKDNKPDGSAQANARLMAAAPKLVEALRPLLEAEREVRTLTTHLGPEHNWYSIVVTEADIRRAAAALKETP